MLSTNSIKKMSTANLLARIAKELNIQENEIKFLDRNHLTEIMELVQSLKGDDLNNLVDEIRIGQEVTEEVEEEVTTTEAQDMAEVKEAKATYDKKLRKAFRRKARREANATTGLWEQEGDDYIITQEDGSKVRIFWTAFLEEKTNN